MKTTSKTTAFAVLLLGVSCLVVAQGPGSGENNRQCCQWTVDSSCAFDWNCRDFGTEYWTLIERHDFPWCVLNEAQWPHPNCTSHNDLCARYAVYDNLLCQGSPIAYAVQYAGHCDQGSSECWWW